MTEYTYEQAQALFKEQAKENEFTQLCNNRKVRDNAGKRDKVEKGMELIYAFLNRGMRNLVKEIKV